MKPKAGLRAWQKGVQGDVGQREDPQAHGPSRRWRFDDGNRDPSRRAEGMVHRDGDRQLEQKERGMSDLCIISIESVALAASVALACLSHFGIVPMRIAVLAICAFSAASFAAFAKWASDFGFFL